MAAAPRNPRELPGNAERSRAGDSGDTPAEKPTLSQQVRARLDRPHKGDVGRPGTNEEVFQGSKMKELL